MQIQEACNLPHTFVPDGNIHFFHNFLLQYFQQIQYKFIFGLFVKSDCLPQQVIFGGPLIPSNTLMQYL